MSIPEVVVNLNAVWTVAASLLVYFMHGGFGFFEAGMTRAKNSVDALSHNLVILALTLAVYWLVGFGLMFGNGNGLLGLTGFAPSLLQSDVAHFDILKNHPVPLAVVFAFALSFADTPATLIAGSGAERIRLAAVVILTLAVSGIIFPVVGHWVMGGGWLATLPRPIYDAGSGLVHLCGGSCALATALFLGPRDKRFRNGERRALAPSSMPMVFLGAFILWLGFFGFNAGFAMVAERSIGLVIANTALAGGFGTVVTMAGSWLLTRKAELRATIIGLLTANVAITSPSAIVSPWAAAAIGALAGVATLGSIRLWAALRIDDPTEYLTMNLVGGALGMLAVGLFTDPSIIAQYEPRPTPGLGLLYGDASQMLVQLLGAGAIILFSLAGCAATCALLRAGGWLRVEPKEEQSGSDKATHGEKAEDSGEAREPQP